MANPEQDKDELFSEVVSLRKRTKELEDYLNAMHKIHSRILAVLTRNALFHNKDDERKYRAIAHDLQQIEEKYSRE